MDYLLGDNPLGNSFMVGFGPKYTLRPHHRGSSLPNIHEHPQQIACGEGFNIGFNNPGPNKQVLQGAIVGGPEAVSSCTSLPRSCQPNVIVALESDIRMGRGIPSSSFAVLDNYFRNFCEALLVASRRECNSMPP